MTPTEKQKCIAEQAVYGDLRAIVDNHFNSDLVFRIDSNGVTLKYTNGEYPLAEYCAVKPVLRPISDLTVEITHKGCNEDKPFIPLVELAKIAQVTTTIDQFNLVNDTVVDFTIAYHFKQNVMWFQSLQRDKKAYILPNQNKFFDLLHQWHFDTRNLIASGEAVDANTLTIDLI